MLLESIIILPILGSIGLMFIPKNNIVLLKQFALTISLIVFVISMFLWTNFDNLTTSFQFENYYNWLSYFNIYYYIGIDGISLFFIILTTFLIPICILTSWNSIKYRLKEFLIIFLITESLLINVFCILDLVLFYIFFESILIPMFLIIGIWGSRERKIHAAYQFFIYTLFGSLVMFLAVLLIYFHLGSTDIHILTTSTFSKYRQIILWLAFFASFAVKIPMIPVHIWLPEAHVEAPTAGSVLLAGVLLKLGTYGLLRFSIPMFPYATEYFTPLIFTMSILAIIYTSCTTIRQIDLKKIIAYSSVAHMNFVTIGLFSFNLQGLEGAIMLMLSHGLVSSALFLCVGALYERYHTRILKYYGGITTIMPLFSILFLMFTLANMSLPGTFSFIGEFLILVGAFQQNTIVTFLASIGVILGAVYSIWLYNRVSFGNLQPQFIQKYCDLNRREFAMFLPLIVLVIIFGIYPNIILNSMHVSLLDILENYKIY